MHENEIYVVREHKIDNPLFTKLHSIIDTCCSDCHKKISITFYIKLYMILNLQLSLKMKK